MHFNLLEEDENLNGIYSLQQLEYLTIFGNPINFDERARAKCIKKMLGLKAIDFNIISVGERYPDLSSNYPKFSPGSKYSLLSWPLIAK